MLTEALRIKKSSLGENHVEVATSLANLGLVEVNLGNFQAAKVMNTESLTIRR